MKRNLGLAVAAAVLVGAIVIGVTSLVRRGDTPARSAADVTKALRTTLVVYCPDHPVETLTSNDKAINYTWSGPLRAKNGDWYAECRKDVVLLSGQMLSTWMCFRVEAENLGVSSIATPGFPLYGDPRLFGALPQNQPCTTIAGWPTP